MGELKPSEPARLFVGVLSRHAECLRAVDEDLVSRFGEVASRSDLIPFTFTNYYLRTMGDNLLRLLLVFREGFDTCRLAEVKRATNELEDAIRSMNRFGVPRPVNVDPGYLTLSKLVLASTKDHAHRVSLGGGIHAEVTLAYRDGAYRPLPWTYPDFRSEPYARFLEVARSELYSAISKNRVGGA